MMPCHTDLAESDGDGEGDGDADGGHAATARYTLHSSVTYTAPALVAPAPTRRSRDVTTDPYPAAGGDAREVRVAENTHTRHSELRHKGGGHAAAHTTAHMFS
jgi:hypothetical protein